MFGKTSVNILKSPRTPRVALDLPKVNHGSLGLGNNEITLQTLFCMCFSNLRASHESSWISLEHFGLFKPLLCIPFTLLIQIIHKKRESI
jgi:hypothetical protein